MSMSDPIADMLTRIRNAVQRQHKSVNIPHSKIKVEMARVLKDEGYIADYEVLPEAPQPVLRVRLRYLGDRRNQRPVITGLERVSKPGRRVYVGKRSIPWVLNGIGVAVMTTSQGVMTDQEARQKGVGGEILCRVW
jgi:small subunit ribosomal protein S8